MDPLLKEMIVEFPQAESCCGALNLRFGIIIVVCIRVLLFVLLLVFHKSIFHTSDSRETDKNGNYRSGRRDCYDPDHVATADLVLLVVTATLIVLWLLIMVPAVIWEPVPVILVGCILEALIWFWFFFIMVYNITKCILGEYVSFLLIFSLVWMLLECYVLWLMWSYYVDVKADLQKLRREGSSDEGSPTTTTTSTY